MFWLVAILVTLAVASAIVAPKTPAKLAVVAAAAAVVGAVAGGIFALTGDGVLPATPLNQRVDSLRARDPGTLSGEERRALLRRIVQLNPEDSQAARFYARELSDAGRHFEAVRSLERATRLTSDPNMMAELGAAAVAANDGIVGDYARGVFRAALDADADHLQALWFMALADLQDGEPQRALAAWADLLERFDENDPRRQVFAMEAVEHLARAPGQPAPSADGPPPDPTEMTARLEERLSKTPQDLPGWLRLARARLVLEGREAAGDVLREADSAFADDPRSLYFIDAARLLWATDGRVADQIK